MATKSSNIKPPCTPNSTQVLTWIAFKPLKSVLPSPEVWRYIGIFLSSWHETTEAKPCTTAMILCIAVRYKVYPGASIRYYCGKSCCQTLTGFVTLTHCSGEERFLLWFFAQMRPKVLPAAVQQVRYLILPQPCRIGTLCVELSGFMRCYLLTLVSEKACFGDILFWMY